MHVAGARRRSHRRACARLLERRRERLERGESLLERRLLERRLLERRLLERRLLLPGASSCPAPEADLVAYYPFEETTGKVAHDCSGKGHDGTIMSAPASGAWTTGRFGGGFATDATSGCIDLGTPADLLLEGVSFTVAAWAKATAFGTSTLSHHIFGKAKLPQSVGWRLGTDPAAWSVRMTDTSLGPLWLQSAGTLATWTHVAATFAPNGAVALYVDGASTATNSLVGITSDPSVTVRIGCRGDNVGYFDGVLDEVRVYRRAFSATEVAALAARTP